MYFIEIDGLNSLEAKNDWNACRILILSKIRQNPNDINLFCRLISECWYVLSNWYCLAMDPNLDYVVFKNTLIASTNHAIQLGSNHVNFLWEIGYMMYLFPELFFDSNFDDQYTHFQKCGIDMIRKARLIKPDDRIIQVILLGFEGDLHTYNRAKKSIQNLIPMGFGGTTAVERYFSECLTDKEQEEKEDTEAHGDGSSMSSNPPSPAVD